MINGGQRTEHAELGGQDSLHVDAAERTDQVRGCWTRLKSLTDLHFLLGREHRFRLLSTTIAQAFQPQLVVTIDPPLADPPREAHRHRNRRSRVTAQSQDHDSQPLRLRRILLDPFPSNQFLQRQMKTHVHGELQRGGVAISCWVSWEGAIGCALLQAGMRIRGRPKMGGLRSRRAANPSPPAPLPQGERGEEAPAADRAAGSWCRWPATTGRTAHT